MDAPPDFQRLRRQTVRGPARRLCGGGIAVAPGRPGRNPGTETRVTAGSRGVNAPTILCINASRAGHSSGAGPGSVTGATRCPAGGRLTSPAGP